MVATAGRTQAAALWAFAGVLWAIAVLGIASIGLFVMPVALLATWVAAARTKGRGLLALVVAAVVVVAGLLTLQAVTADRETGGGSIAPGE